MSLDKDDNDNDEKNIDSYKVIGDEMARFALHVEDKEKADDNNFLITYNDLAGKAPNLVSNPALKTGTSEAKTKGKVKFGQAIKTTSPIKKESKKELNNKSNKNINKLINENIPEESENNAPLINNNINHTLKNSNANALIVNSMTNANTNSSIDKNKNNGINNRNSNVSNANDFNKVIQNTRTNSIVNPNKINNIDDSNRNSIVKTNPDFNCTFGVNINQTGTKAFNANTSIKTINTFNPIKQTNTNKSNYSNNNYLYRNNNLNNNNTNTFSITRSINSNQNNIDSKYNETVNSDDLENIEIEIINPEDLKDESQENILNPDLLKEKVTKNKLSLYEREMRNLKKKKNKLDKERNLIIQKKMSHLQPGPEINDYSHVLISKMEEYVPIHDRAAQIHNRHLTQIILNEELKRQEKKNMEEKEYEEIINNRKKARKYEKEKWDSFVESCIRWQQEVNYKRKAAEIYRNKIDKEERKPKINSKSKKIVKKIQKGNNSVDNVFNRLYNDYEEHKERQKILDDETLPPFSPKINNVKYFNKNSIKNKKKTNKCNNSFDIFITNDKKNNFFLESQNKIIGNKINTSRTIKNKNKIKNPNKFINKNNNINTFKSKKLNPQNNMIKSYKPTQATNNSTIGFNNADENTIGFSKYISTENPIFLETNQYYFSTIANNNYLSDNKIEEISENNDNHKNNKNNFFSEIEGEESIIYNDTIYSVQNNLNPNNNNNNYYNNYNQNNINNPSNNYNKFDYNNNQKNDNNDIYINRNYSNYSNKSKNNDDINNYNINGIDYYDNINNVNLIKESRNKNKTLSKRQTSPKKNKNSDEYNENCCIGTEEMFRDEEILKELNEAKIKYKVKQEQKNENNEDNEENEKSYESLYRLNVMDSTPENMKENVVIPNDKYNKFFNIEGFKDL